MTDRKTLERVTVVDAATNRLRNSLFAGDYEAGQELKDTWIARDHGIARPTARIAVQRLINEGILVRSPGLSARVRTFDPEQVRDLYRVRSLIELDAVQEIREKQLDLGGVAEALKAFSALRGEEDDWMRIAEADAAFHAAVVDAAGSPRLKSYFAGITSEVRLLIALLNRQYSDGDALYQEHEDLYNLLREGAPRKKLVTEWTHHLDSAREFLETRFSA